MVLPIGEETLSYTLLGVFLTLRHIMPHLANQNQHEVKLKGSFGVMTSQQEYKVNSQRIVQIYELLLHYTGHHDHNVITAALETLSATFKNIPKELLLILTTRGSIKKTSIFEDDDPARPKRVRGASECQPHALSAI